MPDTGAPLGRHKVVAEQYDETGSPGSVLNPLLYERLQRRFDSVIIAKQGEAMFGGGCVFEHGYNRYKPLSSGEYYRVCCPFCIQRNAVDTRHRLWINHRWGVGLDPDMPCHDPSDRFWRMAVCYNENCLEDPTNQKTLRNMLYGGIGRELHGERIKIRQGTTETTALGVVEFPGYCQRIDELPMSHQACQYLLSRHMDPQMLGELYDVSFCHESVTNPIVAGKLIIPIYMHGSMVSWQARPPYDTDWKLTGQPKYYNCPRTNKRLMLYGFDRAKVSPFCFVAEGVTDVWAIGDGALSILGKTMAPSQGMLIGSNWQVAVIVLDADAQDRAVKVQDMLERDCNMQGRVVNVRLPDGLDPASIDSEYFWDLVHWSATQAGVDLLNL